MTNKKISIPIGSVEETLLIPLYGRKLATEAFPYYFVDEEANRLIENIDYDFSTMEKRSKGLLYRFGILELAMRQNDLAIEVKEYMSTHPGCTLVNLGCGLDTTMERLSDGSNPIYNIDFPNVIKARETLLGQTEGVNNLAYDLKDYRWMNEVEADKGVIFIGSGLFYYFLREEVKSLFSELSNRFKGGVIAFDIGSKKATKMMNKKFLKQNKMKATSFFYLENPEKELNEWSQSFQVSTKGYMCGYIDVSKDKRVPFIHRKLAIIGDKAYKLKIVKVIL